MGFLLGGGGDTISNVEPRIGAIRVQTSQYGGVVPLVYGHTRIPGNLIWYSNFVATAHTTEVEAGKGGGVTSSTTTYTYTADIQMAICEGPVSSVEAVWVNKTRVLLPKTKFKLSRGVDPQAAWSGIADSVGSLVDSNGSPIFGLLYLQAIRQLASDGTLPEGVFRKDSSYALGYPGIAYVSAAQYDLMNNAELQNHSFEVKGLKSSPFSAAEHISDALPSEIIKDFLTHAVHGVGFPLSKLSGLNHLYNYTAANDVLLSPVLIEQKPAVEWLRGWLQLCNCDAFFSEGLLKFATYGDTSVTSNNTGVTFTADLTPQYDLDDNDFLRDGSEDPVKVTRRLQADAFNQAQIECIDKNKSFNVTMVMVEDSASVSLFGVRAMPVIKAHEFTRPFWARKSLQKILQRQLFIRNTYEFKTGPRYALLEPMDLVTLTDTALGLDRKLVRILSVEESEDGVLEFTAEETLTGIADAAEYATQDGAGYEADYNAEPGNTLDPVIFEAPFSLATGGLELWLAAAGGINWGGCEVWVSTDNLNYRRVGTKYGPSRYGYTRSAMAVQPAADTTTQLKVDLTNSAGKLISDTSPASAPRESRRTLCLVNGEFFNYRVATLTDTYQYTLSDLTRGLYNSKIVAHAAGRKFVRCDTSLFRYPFDENLIGVTLYIKLLSINLYKGATQSIADVEPYTYKVTGRALTEPFDTPTNLTTVYRDGRLYLAWDRMTDPVRTITYEVRRGGTFATAAILARLTDPEMLVAGDGTYWVSAVSARARSATPATVVITGSRLAGNVIQTWDEHATSWLGTMTGGAADVGGDLVLSGSALFSTAGTVSAITDLISTFGGIDDSGTYEVPSAHVVDVGTVQPCNVDVELAFLNVNPNALFSDIPLVSLSPSISGNRPDLGDVFVEIATSDAAGTFGAWQRYIPGVYQGRKFKLRLLLESYDSTNTPVVTAFKFTVDMPDRRERGTAVAIAAGGTAVTFATPFQIVPNVQITILNAAAGDTVIFTAGPTAAGFTVQVLNGGVGVGRNINWLAEAY